ncbi:MAG: gas vesicle protein [Pirellula sp.]|jgi:hypothetical protein|nr:gas vesicle protein [Pirellula sp.]
MSVENEQLAKSITLCDAIDRLLNKGVVLTGDITVSVAGVDLLYIGLRGIVMAVDLLDELPPSLSHGNQGVSQWRQAS